MYSGARTGFMSTDIQQEQQEHKKWDQEAMVFEAEFQYAETIFEKLRHRRNLKLESLEQRRKAEKDSDELCTHWGKGPVHSQHSNKMWRMQ